MIEINNISQFLRSTDGVNQLQRSLPALNPNFVHPDERNKSDIIGFLRELSKQIQFHNLDNQPNGDWLPFFNLFDTGSSILATAATTGPLPSVIYDNGIDGAGATLTATAIGPLAPQDGVIMANGNLLLVWQQKDPVQNGVYIVTQGTNSTVFLLQRSDKADQSAAFTKQMVEIEQGVQHAKRFFIQRKVNPVIGSSDIQYLKGGLSRTDWPPNQALLMAFLHLFSIAQRDMNELTGRHLRYYYQDVLKLHRKQSQPDQVHVVFEAAKNATSVPLPAGTLLDAGKTSDGKESRQYALESEIVVNHAIVKSLKSAYVDVNPAGKMIVYKAEDAALVKSETGTAWRPFGTAQFNLSPESKTMTEAKLGFAIASPALFLAEGERTITLILTTNPEPPEDMLLSNIFEVALTSDKGWITPKTFTPVLTTKTPAQPRKISFEMTLSMIDGPLVGYNQTIHGIGYNTVWPVLRFILKPESFQIETLTSFAITNIEIDISAVGVKNLILQNDESIQQVDKPIFPFGSQPVVNSNFYIGSNEVFSKSLRSLAVSLEWKDPPESFRDYYKGYDNTRIGYQLFMTDMYLLAGKSWNYLVEHALFDGSATGSINTIEAPALPDIIQSSTFERKPGMAKIEAFSSSLDQGFIKLVLAGPTALDAENQPEDAPFEAFGHKCYPVIYTRKAIDLSKPAPLGDGILPNQPYTPVLKSVTLDYSATESFIPSIPNGTEQFFLLDIFGNAELNKNEAARFAPSFSSQGALYVGVEKATPPQTLSFLFQIERGNVPGAELLKNENLSWSYLAGNQWQSLRSGDVLEEATDALQKPGIIRLNLGSNANSAGLLMPAGLHWLKLSVDQKADGAGAVQEVLAQAARGTLVSNVGVTQVIQPKTISRLVNKIAAIKSVNQSYPSFNGLPSESDTGFFRRISERLRHRNRAVTSWDYERLILERFPDVFKVKCLPYTSQDNKILPGHIKLVAVPDMRVNRSGKLLQPRSNIASLREIETFLKEKYLSGFVIPHADNPDYETLLVDCSVSFHHGFDPGFYTAQLQEDIRRFLSPWAYDEGQDIIFGGKIYKSEILAFIEGRPYVDFVINFRMYHRFDGERPPGGISCMTIGVDFTVGTKPSPMIRSTDGSIAGGKIGVDFVIGAPVEIAVATSPEAILVSNEVHRIRSVQSGSFTCSGVSSIGIGKMIIDLDFTIVS